MEVLKKVLNSVISAINKVSVPFKPLISRLSNIKSIKSKLILAFVVPILLIILQGIISYSSTSKTAVTLASQSSITAMESSGKYLDVVLKTVESLSGQLFADADIQSYLSESFKNDNILEKSRFLMKVETKLANISTFSPDISNIMVVSNKENVDSLSTFLNSSK